LIGPLSPIAPDVVGRTRDEADKLAGLEFENSRLRQLVIDLMLEKIKLEEACPEFHRLRDETSQRR